jgi:hypothetical protein
VSKTKRGKSRQETLRKHDKQIREKVDKSPCNRPPIAPTTLTGVFSKHHGRKRHNHWQLLVKWDEVSTDTSGITIPIGRYRLEVYDSATEVDDLAEGTVEQWNLDERFLIPAKDDTDPGDKVHKLIKNIHGKLAYAYRVRAEEQKDGCKGEWAYFTVGTPEDGPPAPSDVKILRRSHGIRLRWRAPVDDDDDELFTQDVVAFVARLWTNEDFGPVQAFTAVGSTDVFTATSHGFANGDPIMLRNTPGGSSLPDGVLPFKLYYLTNFTTDTFKLAREEDAAAINITTDGSGDVMWGLVRVQRHTHQHHVDFRIDTDDFEEDTLFYGEVASESDHRSKSAFIPATAPLPNDDPDATPTGKKPSWHRHVFTFTILGPVEVKTYRAPDRADDDYRIRRVTASAGKAGSGGGATKFDIKINGSTFVFDGDTDKMTSFASGDHDGSSNQVVNRDLDRGDHIRVQCEETAATPPEDVTIHVIADRRHTDESSDSGGGGGE